MSKQKALNLDEALEKNKMTLASLHREMLARGEDITYHTLQNWKGKGNAQPPSTFRLINVICDILKTTPDKLLK